MIIQFVCRNWMKTVWTFLFSFLIFASHGCNNETKIFTVGIASWDAEDNQILKGFKHEMVKRGYIEGDNVRYKYELIPAGEFYNIPIIKSNMEDFLAQDLDLLLVLGREVILAANELVAGTDLPVLFGGNLDPVKDGLVDSLLQPGGNFTGVRDVNNIPKAMEWLVRITDARKVYVPYDPGDSVSTELLEGIHETAAQLGIELILSEVYSVEETIEAIENLPADYGAVFRVPSPLLDPRSIEISQAAIRRRIAMFSPHYTDDEILATFAPDLFNVGEKLAYFAQKIENGEKPSNLLVETINIYFTINLKTAEKIGLDIPNDVLVQAKRIIR